VEPYRSVLFNVEASVRTNADFLPERVLRMVEESLRARFSFEARSFGQPVFLSEVISVIQEVPGVVAVDVGSLYRECEPDDGDSGDVADLGDQCKPGETNPRLDARGPQVGVAAELLTLNPAPLFLEEMA
jgi:hypothetical protein